jgi:hypothetical protein
MRSINNGTIDFGSRFVHGMRGKHHLILRWDILRWDRRGDDRSFTGSGGAKLGVSNVDVSVVQRAMQQGP